MSSTISGRLFFKAVKATNLKDTDLLSNPDCYVAVKSGKKLLGRTKTSSDTVNPVWQQSLHFDAEHNVGENITLEIYDKDSITRDDSLGFVTIPVGQLPHRNEDGDEEVTVRLEGKRAKENSTFTYSISFRKFSWEDEVALLEQNNIQLQQNIERLRGENNRLEVSTQKLHSEVEDLKKINTDLENNVQHLHNENTNLAHVCEGFKTENEKFAASNARLHDNVVTFKEQNSKLKTISDSLREENEKFKVQVDHLSSTITGLETVKQTMQSFADADKQGLGAIFEKLNSTLAEQKEVYKEQQTVLQDTKTATKQQEKILLLQLHSQCQYLDADAGLDKKEFQLWVSLIPQQYLDTPNGLAFSQVDKDRDGKISVEEFNALVEKLVQDA